MKVETDLTTDAGLTVVRLQAQTPPPVPERSVQEAKETEGAEGEEEEKGDTDAESRPSHKDTNTNTGTTTNTASEKTTNGKTSPPTLPVPPATYVMKPWEPSETTPEIHSPIEVAKLTDYVRDFPKTAKYRGEEWHQPEMETSDQMWNRWIA